MVQIGKIVPKTKLPATGEQQLSLHDFKGQYLIVYFYPKDNTPGCTQEGQDFRDHYKKFQKLNCDVLGVSRDSARVHENFRAKHQFPFHLLADTEEKLCNGFGVIQEKKNYGRTYMGIVRSTFLIGPDSKLLHEWRNIRVKGHVERVLETLEAEHAE